MSFRDQLQPAKYGKAPFHVVASDTGVGRRTVLHEFPGRKTSFSEDMGPATSEFVVEGFIIGDDYLDGMKVLIAELMKAGPRTLIHPSLGTLQVALASKARLREKFIEQRGMVTFSLAFFEAGDEPQPSTVVDTQQAVEDWCDAAYAAICSEFSARFSIAGMPAWSVDSIVNEITTVTDVIGKARNNLRFPLTSLSALNRVGNLFKANFVSLLATPNAFATELTVEIRGLVGLFDFSAAQTSVFGESSSITRPAQVLMPLAQYGQSTGDYARPAIEQTTPVRKRQAANQDAVFALVSRTAAIEAVRSSVFIPFTSLQDANTMRDQLYDMLEELMLDAPDDVYASLKDVQVAMVRDITARGADLATFTAITLPGSVPARVLSYRLYGDGKYADEIIARNQAPGTLMHPLFIPGGTALEVRRV